MHHRQWHPNGTPNRKSFTWSRQLSAAGTVREWHQMAPTVGVLADITSRAQRLYLDFRPGVCGAGDENRTRVLSLGKKKGGHAYDGESGRPIRAGHRIIRMLRNDRERLRSRDIRGMTS
jgi:hypothetical protein